MKFLIFSPILLVQKGNQFVPFDFTFTDKYVTSHVQTRLMSFATNPVLSILEGNIIFLMQIDILVPNYS